MRENISVRFHDVNYSGTFKTKLVNTVGRVEPVLITSLPGDILHCFQITVPQACKQLQDHVRYAPNDLGYDLQQAFDPNLGLCHQSIEHYTDYASDLGAEFPHVVA